ncbi:hypothetical protein BGX27_007866 [Mortierella sp. AM989]|nr:hypothetical protein BGX27_007866 [Mortierella sp. AM989]
MAKGDIQTPPGTGHVGTLTPDQKVLLKQMWAEIYKIQDTGSIDVPSELAVPASDSASVASKGTVKKGWFGSSKATTDEPANAIRINLADIGLTVEQLRPALWNNVLGDHPDALVLRFLRARKWNVGNGMNMCLKAFKWRVEDDVEEVKATGELELDAKYRGFRHQMEIGKSYFHGVDKLGRPVVYINVRLHKPSEQDPKALEKFTIYVMEIGRLMIQPPVETACVVFDMTGFTLANMDYGFVKFLVQCFEAYYPESLGVLVIHKAPLVFWGVWKIIEPWLDPVVASKIKFCRSDKDLAEIIDPNNMPTKYEGGMDQYIYEYLPPQADENDIMKDTVNRTKATEHWQSIAEKFETLTREWIASDKPGSRSEDVIEAERLAITKELRTAYFAMDPYIRATTLYHRSNNIHRDGTATWTYKN